MTSRNGTDRPKFVFDLASSDPDVVRASLMTLASVQRMDLIARSTVEAFGGGGGMHVVHLGMPFDQSVMDAFKAGEFDDQLVTFIGHESDEIAVTAATLLANKDGGYRKMVEALLDITVTDESEEDSLGTTLVKLATGEREFDDPQDAAIALLMSGDPTCINAVYDALREKLRPEPDDADAESDEREPATAS